jgi:hypothetical protein
MWVDYDVPNWFLTWKNFYRSPFLKWLQTRYDSNLTIMKSPKRATDNRV